MFFGVFTANAVKIAALLEKAQKPPEKQAA